MSGSSTAGGGDFEAGRFEIDTSETFRPRVAPRSVYIHIPFCRHRCGYCNFTLVAGRDELIEQFLNALEIEIGWLDRTYQVDTLFLGGGTPSHLSPAQLDRLNSIVRSRFEIHADAEVSAECNPNDVSAQRMAALTRLGVNRVSLGVQSLNPEKLKTLERDHDVSDIRNAIDAARNHDVSVSMDLMFATPDESLQGWKSDLELAIELTPDHLSTYELTYEKGTRFWNTLNRGNLNISDEDLRAEMYSWAIERLATAGLEQYEISSFAPPEHQCRHNRAYWTGDPYFAFGPGAARFVDGIRETNHRSTTRYLKLVESGVSPVAEQEKLEGLEAAQERLAIVLRMIEGVDGSEFEQWTGVTVSEVLGDLEVELVNNQLMIRCGDRWSLTRKGIFVCDWIAGEIVGR